MDRPFIQSNGNPAANRLTLRDAVGPIFRQRRVASAIFLGVFCAGLLGVLSVSDRYTAEMKILVTRVATFASGPEAASTTSPEAPVTAEEVNSEAELLKIRDLLRGVAIACQFASAAGSNWSRAVNWMDREMDGAVSGEDVRLAPSRSPLRATCRLSLSRTHS